MVSNCNWEFVCVICSPALQSNLSSSDVFRNANRAQDGLLSLKPPSFSQNENDISQIH